jgi:hypothetical protein
MRKPPDFKTKIGGRTWQIRFVRKDHPKVVKCWGKCYWEPREIYVRHDLARSTVREVLIHEMIHATCRLMFVAEEWVDHSATEINNGLNKAGL